MNFGYFVYSKQLKPQERHTEGKGPIYTEDSKQQRCWACWGEGALPASPPGQVWETADRSVPLTGYTDTQQPSGLAAFDFVCTENPGPSRVLSLGPLAEAFSVFCQWYFMDSEFKFCLVFATEDVSDVEWMKHLSVLVTSQKCVKVQVTLIFNFLWSLAFQKPFFPAFHF